MQINTSGPVIFIDEPRLIDTCHLGATDRWENILIGRWESQTALRVKLTSSRVDAFTKFSSFQKESEKNPSSWVVDKVCEAKSDCWGASMSPSGGSTGRQSVWRSCEEPSTAPQASLPGVIIRRLFSSWRRDASILHVSGAVLVLLLLEKLFSLRGIFWGLELKSRLFISPRVL